MWLKSTLLAGLDPWTANTGNRADECTGECAGECTGESNGESTGDPGGEHDRDCMARRSNALFTTELTTALIFIPSLVLVATRLEFISSVTVASLLFSDFANVVLGCGFCFCFG